MPRVEFVGQSAREGATRAASPSRLVNLYREPSGEGMMLRAVPGSYLFAEIDTSLMRDMIVANDKLYAVAGGGLYEIKDDNTTVSLGSVGFDPLAALSSNGSNVLATSAGRLWNWDGEDFAEITGLPFDRKASVCYLGGYSVVAQRGGKQFAWSDLSDPTVWPGLNFATADIADEAIVKMIVVADTLFIFGQRSLERWALTGAANQNAIARISGGSVETGLLSGECITKLPGGAAFVSSDKTVCLWSGGVQVISTPAVNAAVDEEQPESLFYYEARGHGFVVVSFRSRPAWVYDLATQEWHERAEGREGAWQARKSAFWRGGWYLGDDLGRILAPSDVRADMGAPLIRRAVSRRFDFDAMRTLALVEAFPRVGVDKEANDSALLDEGPGALVLDDVGGMALGMGGHDSGPAQVNLRLSIDGGMTFGKLRPRDLGARGNYRKRVTWVALGACRSAVVELSCAAIEEAPMRAELNMVVA